MQVSEYQSIGYVYPLFSRYARSTFLLTVQAESDVCPVCHTDRQFNKNLRLLVSPCYHKMYVGRLWSRHKD
jgi:hypothetical protein